MTLIHQPHDKFFRQSLKERRIALDFFKAHLPAKIYSRLDLSTLQATDKSYLSPNLAAIQSDLVYQCQIKGHAGYLPILFLLEHQSTADPHMAFRLLQYMFHLMDDHLKAGHNKLPVVLPLCVYHGERSPYPYSRDIYDDFEDTHLARAVVFKPFHLIDLTSLPIETLAQHGTVALMEILFKQSQAKQLIRTFKQLDKQDILQIAVRNASGTYLISVLNYVLSQENHPSDQSADRLIQALTTALPERTKEIMTFAQQLEQRGIQQGMQQGIEQGIQQGMQQGIQQGMQQGMQAGIYQNNRDIVKKMLRQGADYQFIETVTGLSREEIDSFA